MRISFNITRRRSIPGGNSQIDRAVTEIWYALQATGAPVSNFGPKQTIVESFPSTPSSKGTQVTVSESHPEWSFAREGKISGDIGGEFSTTKSSTGVEYPDRQSITWTKPYPNPDSGIYQKVTRYSGPIMAGAPETLPFPNPGSLRDLAPLGSIAIARVKPTNVTANAAVFLAELYRDGLPRLFGASLWKENTQLARSAGEEYLNSEFGWKPMISDVHGMYHAVTHAHAVLSQLERGSGSLTRRRYEFPLEKTQVRSMVSSSSDPIMSPGNYSSDLLDTGISGSELWKETTSWKKVWFSGAFTYHLPTGYRSRNALERYAVQAQTLTGLNLTPEVLWQAAPWSWAIDWFSNAGEVVSNLSDWATDGLVLKYGYVMEHSFIRDRYYLVGTGRLRRRFPLAHASSVYSFVETKRRVKATPFGFGLSWSGLSPRQLAIAAALGITRWR
jgi:hypothetical protein